MSNKLVDINKTSDFSPIFIKLPVHNIVELKFIVESYEGLAIVRTLDVEKGHVLIMSLEKTRADVLNILDSIAKDLSLELIDDVEISDDDWLWNEVKKDLKRAG